MKQYEAVMKVMADNGGYATFGHLYKHVLNVPGVKWGTKTPFATMRRIVQERPEIFRIKPGLWALKEWKDRLPVELNVEQSSKKKALNDHSYYQGLLLEIGKLCHFDTFVPAQDKNKIFLGNQKLGDIATQKAIPQFGYEPFLRPAKTIDVIWFNERKMPNSFFEVEHSTDIKNSLLKFVELQDFRAQMVIVADQARKAQFKKALDMIAFSAIRKYVDFLGYEELSNKHTRAHIKNLNL